MQGRESLYNMQTQKVETEIYQIKDLLTHSSKEFCELIINVSSIKARLTFKPIILLAFSDPSLNACCLRELFSI